MPKKKLFSELVVLKTWAAPAKIGFVWTVVFFSFLLSPDTGSVWHIQEKRYSIYTTALGGELLLKSEMCSFWDGYWPRDAPSSGKNIYYCKSNERLCCAVLTGRRVVWSPRCPRSSLQVAVGGAEEGAKAGLAFPQGGPLPPEALLLECLRTPTERWKKKKQIKREKQRGSKKNMQMERNWHRTSDTNWWKGWGRREW